MQQEGPDNPGQRPDFPYDPRSGGERAVSEENPKFGIGDNQYQWANICRINPLYKGFTLCNINLLPFANNYDDPIILPASRVYAAARAHGGNARPLELDTCAVGESMAAGIPAELRLPRAEAVEKFKEIVSRIPYLNFSADYTRNILVYLRDINGGEEVADIPAFMATLNNRRLMDVLLRAADLYIMENPTCGGTLMVSSLVAVLKRGSVSDGFRVKLTDGLRQAGISAQISEQTISNIFLVFGQYVSSELVTLMINRWLAFIPTSSLRLRLTVQQAEWEGLTCYVTIRQAAHKYQDFPWDRLCRMTTYATEMNVFITAATIIGNDKYYGFNSDLRNVKSTLYKNLATVCKMLLVRIAGETALNAYGGFKTRVVNQDTVVELINQYISRDDNEEGGDLPEGRQILLNNYLAIGRLPLGDEEEIEINLEAGNDE